MDIQLDFFQCIYICTHIFIYYVKFVSVCVNIQGNKMMRFHNLAEKCIELM